jgi:hypothetical protein
MALASKGCFMNVTLADEAGNKSTLNYQLTHADIAALNTNIADVATVLTALNAVTDARVVAYSIGQGFGEDADFYGAANSEVENVALISAKVDSAVPGKTVSLRIPAPAISIFQGNTGENKNIVDITDNDLRTYLGLFESTGPLLVSDGESIMDSGTVGNFKGKRIHRGSRNG